MSARSALFAGVFLLAGCSSTEDTFFLETLELKGGELHLQDGAEGAVQSPQLKGVSVDAKQRFVWSPEIPVREPVEELSAGYARYEVRPRSVVCAELSPDALSALAAELGGKLAVQAGDVVPGGSLDAQFKSSFDESVQSIGKRTQLIQLMRDTLYRACEAYANGALDSFGYAMILSQFDVFMVQLLGIDALGTEQRGPNIQGPTANAAIAQIVGASMRGTTVAAPGRVTRTACMIWFAQHPEVKIRRVNGYSETVGEAPAIADLCLRVIENAIKVEVVQQAREAGASPAQVQTLYDKLAH